MIYAVNKFTKEHQAVPETNVTKAFAGAETVGDWKLVQADADGWIEWSGGECPLPDMHRYEVKTHEGEILSLVHPQLNYAWKKDWGDSYCCYSIAAYRPIIDQPVSEEPNGWDGAQDGLPDVGDRVEIKIGEDSWCPGKVIMHHEGQALVYLDSASQWRYKSGNENTIRPIRTDRERWIEAAVTLRIPGQDGIGLAAAQAIYDAGLAKLREQTK